MGSTPQALTLRDARPREPLALSVDRPWCIRVTRLARGIDHATVANDKARQWN